MTTDRGVESARQALKVAFGVVPFLAGLDKFFNLLADWPRYLSPAAEAILPVTGQTFMYFAGVAEMVVGLAIRRGCASGSSMAAATPSSLPTATASFDYGIAVPRISSGTRGPRRSGGRST